MIKKTLFNFLFSVDGASCYIRKIWTKWLHCNNQSI